MIARKYKRPAPLDLRDSLTTGFRLQLQFSTDISANTYSAAIKDRKDDTVLIAFTVVSDTNNVILTLTKTDKAGLNKKGDFYWDLLEKTPTNPDGSLLFNGNYSLSIAATEN